MKDTPKCKHGKIKCNTACEVCGFPVNGNPNGVGYCYEHCSDCTKMKDPRDTPKCTCGSYVASEGKKGDPCVCDTELGQLFMLHGKPKPEAASEKTKCKSYFCEIEKSGDSDYCIECQKNYEATPPSSEEEKCVYCSGSLRMVLFGHNKGNLECSECGRTKEPKNYDHFDCMMRNCSVYHPNGYHAKPLPTGDASEELVKKHNKENKELFEYLRKDPTPASGEWQKQLGEIENSHELQVFVENLLTQARKEEREKVKKEAVEGIRALIDREEEYLEPLITNTNAGCYKHQYYVKIEILNEALKNISNL